MVNKCFLLSYLRTQERDIACFKGRPVYFTNFKVWSTSLPCTLQTEATRGCLVPLQSWSHPQTLSVYRCVWSRWWQEGWPGSNSVASQKADEPVSWHVWCMSPLCHDSFTTVSVNNPSASFETDSEQSMSDETCVKVDLIWLTDWTKWCLYKEESRLTRCQRLWYM